MAKDSRRTLRTHGTTTRTSSSHSNVTVGRDYITVKYRSFGKNRTVRLSRNSLIESANKALGEVPVIAVK